MRNSLFAGLAARRSALSCSNSNESSNRSSRRRWRGWAALVVPVVLGACEVIPTGVGLGSAGADASAVQGFVSMVNAHRAAIGCPSLSWDARVAEVALRHSRDMASRDYFSHTNPDGVDPWQRLAQAGVRYGTAGENIAWGQESAQEVYSAWMNSAPHRRNIENCAFTHHGVGEHQGRWTHVFIRPS